MATTPNLNLPLIDENTVNDMPRDLNALAEAVDASVTEAVEGVTIPDASLTEKGIVQLSNAINGTRENVAPTEKALKAAYDRGSEGVTAAAAAQSKANAAETPAGAQSKANAAEANAKSYVDAKPWQKHKVSADDGAAIDISGQNLDNILLTGFYKGSSMINAPGLSASWGYVEVIRHAETWVLQKVYDLHADRFFMRRRTDSGWTAWTQDLFTSVANGKQAIATAISGKGVPALGSDEFAVLAQKIGQIKTGYSYANIYVGTVETGIVKTVDIGFAPRVIIIHETQSTAKSNYREYAAGKKPDGTDWTNGQYASIYLTSPVQQVIQFRSPSYVYNVEVWAWE